MYDYFLGGKDNYPADRNAAEQVKAKIPNTYEAVWENRYFLQRAVRYLAEAGIDQFVDLGTGLPTRGNVHEIAQGVNPDAHVVYVDNDPIVLAHGRALLATNPNTTVITADIREPDGILGHPGLRALIDFDRPCAVLFVAIMHFIPDEADPYGSIAAFRDVLAPGSYLTLSHLTPDMIPPDQVEHLIDGYKAATSPMVLRARPQIERMFEGFELVAPGLVHPWQWQPWLKSSFEDKPMRTDWLWAGVGRKIPAPETAAR
jgi:hypothetical protein